MTSKLGKRKALRLIASYGFDEDIPLDVRMDMVLGILKATGIDYSNKEDENAELV